ncbi:plectin-like [Brienomyrus brachyistius]|uniref:plectin-like n=1 Tax=Brienomyrus brachyistius TaxID=42636 RepID=UPI0020B280E8|nr:plectin-like [Brienomyrus brachyistius]
MASRKRSAVWPYFQDGMDPNKTTCLVCSETIQHCGNTSNLLKHLRSKHQAEFADVEAKRRPSEGASVTAFHHTMEPGDYPEILDSVAVEDVKHDRLTEEAPAAADAGAAAETCYLSGATSKKRSAVWTYYQDDEDGNKALCLICLENIQHRRNTSNLLKHLRKRHPAEYADVEDRTKRRQAEDGVIASPPCAFKHQTTLQNTCRNATKYPDILEVITVGQSEEEQIRRALEQEARALERERELTEQLRRAQEQEARALEQQRALTDQLRRAQEEEMKRARELEAGVLQRERQAIEQLRRAQEQEARAIEREREALARMREELERDRRLFQRQREAAGQGRQGEVTLKTENADPGLEVTT